MKHLLETIRGTFSTKKIVVIGDLVADQFLRGTIDRVSREAPVFIMRHDETETVAGGGANAAVNSARLSAKTIAVGIIGDDSNGRALKASLKQANVDDSYIVSSTALKTTTKVRVLAGQHFAQRQQVIRIDYENENAIGADLIESLKQNAINAVKEADAIIISDYNYGVAAAGIVEAVSKIARKRKIPLLIDSRLRLTEFSGATSATPNQEEVEQILGVGFSVADCVKLRGDLELEALLVTRGNQGMLLVEKDKPIVILDAVGSKEPVDVTGAGDTVIAAYALGLASGLSYEESARIANHAGGIVVMKKGTASVTQEELIESIVNDTNKAFAETK